MCPGPILADRFSRRLGKIGLTAEESDACARPKTFVGREGQPHEVAAAVLDPASVRWATTPAAN
jgi:hypothetical protein